MTTTLDVLRNTTFGQRVAEEEGDQLSEYFVETDHWNRVSTGQADIIYGAKGSGKSALYSLLVARSNAFFDKAILLVACENPRGAPAFKALMADPPASEHEFVALWKLYFACLLSSTLKDYGVGGSPAQTLQSKLAECELVTEPGSLQRTLKAAYDYVKRVLRPSAFEVGAKIDAHTQLPTGITAKIIFSEPSQGQIKRGYSSVDELIELAHQALSSAGFRVWLLLDRLDVAFSESAELETNALRALFRTYLDLRPYEAIHAKIFIRTDIWRKITSSGFREASHITRHVTIEWDTASLMNLVVSRAAQNERLLAHCGVSRNDALQSASSQRAFFYQLFPSQVDIGPNKPETFEWMLSRTRDGTKQTAPRELIHLINALRSEQVRSLELGKDEAPDNKLFSRGIFRDALFEVSRTRLEQTLYAEYPDLKPATEALRKEKTQHSVASLAQVWRCAPTEAEATTQRLVEVGFFEQRGSRHAPVLWVPFLYRDALDMVQGSAEATSSDEDALPSP